MRGRASSATRATRCIQRQSDRHKGGCKRIEQTDVLGEQSNIILKRGTELPNDGCEQLSSKLLPEPNRVGLDKRVSAKAQNLGCWQKPGRVPGATISFYNTSDVE